MVHIFVSVYLDRSLAETASIDNAGVVQTVTEDRVTFVHKGWDDTSVCGIA
jgi:hypothetical protein